MATHAPLTVEHLMARARREAGLQNIGTTAFDPPLRKLVDATNAIMDNIHDKGRVRAEEWIVRLLVNRLRIQDDIEQHPEILSQNILPPSAIIGLPRTGSSKLQHLLAAGHGFLEPLFWQLWNPAPFPGNHPVFDKPVSDPRIQAAVNFVASFAEAAPDAHKGHVRMVEQADEECYLLDLSLQTPSTISFIPAYDWVEYIERLDKTDMYTYFRTCLQYLQWQFHPNANKPWLLKYPANLGNETYMCRAFPGIKFVVTHRDPFPVMASLSQLISANQMFTVQNRDLKRFSIWAFEEFASEMDRHLAWRDANPDVEVLDVSFKDIVHDGLGVARRIYTFFGAEWTTEAEAKIRDWLDENERQKDKLEYSFDDIAYTKEDCHKRFADYYERFSHLF